MVIDGVYKSDILSKYERLMCYWFVKFYCNKKDKYIWVIGLSYFVIIDDGLLINYFYDVIFYNYVKINIFLNNLINVFLINFNVFICKMMVDWLFVKCLKFFFCKI